MISNFSCRLDVSKDLVPNLTLVYATLVGVGTFVHHAPPIGALLLTTAPSLLVKLVV